MSDPTLSAASARAEAALPSFPMPRSCPLRPPDDYARMRAEAPVTKVRLRHGRTAWLLTRAEDVRHLLVHPQVSADRQHPGFPLQVRMPTGIPGKLLTSLIGMDPPEHTVLRRMIIPEFTVKGVQRLRPRIEEIAAARLDAMLASGRSADLMEAYALPVASMLICELLGVPYGDHAFFTSRTEIILGRGATESEQYDAYADLLAYFDDAVCRKERQGADDLLGRLILRLRDAGSYDRETVVGIGRLMVVAGHEATPGMIGLGTIALLGNPSLLASLRTAGGSGAGTVDELLRYFSISDQSTFRVAVADIEIAGVVIRAGEGIIGLNASANWDDRYIPGPEELNVDRAGVRHLAFGFGPHQCIAQHLARLNIQVALFALFDRVPGLRLTVPVDRLRFKDDQLVYGIYELPVAW